MEFLGYDFKNEALLAEALTTPSYRMDYPQAQDNQRLEFLGDAVLGLLAGERLYAAFPKEPEGPLTVRRTQMVSSAALCAAANRFGLIESLRRNRGAAPLDPEAKTLADAVEAVIGAAYLEGGLPAARQIFETLALTSQLEAKPWHGNPKGELQMRVQALKPPRHPLYEVIKTDGAAHEPIFTVRASVEGLGEAVASARSRRAAEAEAAAALLTQMDLS